MVKITVPPPRNVPDPIFDHLPRHASLFRIYNPTRHGQSCCSFRRFGPVARFDHHRHPETAPALDNDRAIYYAASSLSGCIVEVFGDTGEIVCGDYCLALVRTTRKLRLLDLCGDGAMRAGTVAAIAKADHTLARSWSCFFYEEPVYGNVDGLKYYNAHNDEVAYALYERCEAALECMEEMRLDAPELRDRLGFVAKRTNLLLFD